MAILLRYYCYFQSQFTALERDQEWSWLDGSKIPLCPFVVVEPHHHQQRRHPIFQVEWHYSQLIKKVKELYPSTFAKDTTAIKVNLHDQAYWTYALEKYGQIPLMYGSVLLPSVHVSLDGSTFSLSPHDMPSYDSHTLYIESLPRTWRISELSSYLSEWGSVEHIYVPWEAGGPFHDNLLISLLGSCWIDTESDAMDISLPDRPIEDTTHAKYVLVRFSSPQAMQKAYEALSPCRPPLTRHSELLFSGNKQPFDSIRVMTKQNWLERTKEYLDLLNERLKLVKQRKAESSGQHVQGAQFTMGVIGKFTGVHPRTHRKVLQKLFSAVSPIAFVDYTTGSTQGFVRFKTAHGASTAQIYFKNHPISQLHKEDYGAFPQKSEHKGKPVIRLFILQDREEENYWKTIRQERRKKTEAEKKAKRQVEEKRQEILQLDTSEKTKHVRFDDTSDEDEQEAKRVKIE